MTPALLTIFATSFAVALSGAMMPGPFLTVTISEGSRRGAIAGPLMICGHGLLELLLIVALLSGFGAVLARHEVFTAISLVGGATLLWMAWSMLRSLPGLNLPQNMPGGKRNNLVMAGMVMSAANPYWLIWWASIGLGSIMHSARFGAAGVAAFFIGHLLADLLWHTLVAFTIAKGRRLLTRAAYQRLIGGCAVLLLLFSGYFFYSGVTRLV